ncbi:hypothetical protein [Rhodocyclus gracilis]|nr:hypothetical protein [Rhodocyclus gracilis]
MSLPIPSTDAIMKGVIITAISLVIINFAKPYLPDQVKSLLSA